MTSFVSLFSSLIFVYLFHIYFIHNFIQILFIYNFAIFDIKKDLNWDII